MNAKHFKTVAITLLLIAAVYLGYTVLSLYRVESVLKKQNARNTADILAARDYEINISDIPSLSYNAPVYESEPADSSFYMEIAAGMSKSAVESANLLPEGLRIKCKNGDVWFFGKGSYFEYICAEYEQYQYGELDFTESADASLSRIYSDAANALLTPRVSQSASFSLVLSEALKAGDFVKCAFDEYINGCPVISKGVEAVFYNGKIIYASGNRVFAAIIRSVAAPLFDQFNILLKESAEGYDGNFSEKKRITELFPCNLVFYNENTKSFFAVPSWCIVYDGGQRSVYNAVNCEKTS